MDSPPPALPPSLARALQLGRENAVLLRSSPVRGQEGPWPLEAPYFSAERFFLLSRL